MARKTRRGLIRTLGAAAMVGITGCSATGGGGSDGSANETPTNSTDQSSDSEPSTDHENWPMYYQNSAKQAARPDHTSPPEELDKVWEFSTGDSGPLPPTVAQGKVFLPTRPEGAEGWSALYAVDATDGTDEWRFTPEGVLTTTAAWDEGTLYVGGTEGLYGVDASAGEQLWFSSLSSSFAAVPVVSGGVVYFATSDGTVHARNASDGSELWTFGTEGRYFGGLSVTEETLVMARGETMYALDPASGTERWTAQVRTRYEAPTIADGGVYVGDDEGNFIAYDAEDGSQRWRLGDGPYSAAAYADGTLYSTGFSDVYAVDSQTGAVEWSTESQGQIQSTAQVVGDTVFVGSMGFLLGYDVSTGERTHGYESHYAPHPPAFADGRIHFVTAEHRLHTLGEES